ncbi:EipB family protein [Dongia sp.]|uniref:EipB family protein n=1 Tax=Dongia sp. TaxID=1977262 RepID=UPI0035B29131
MISGLLRRFSHISALIALIVPLGGGSALADLLPHRAVYVLGIGAGSTMSGGDGVMSYEIKDVCDGWAVDLKAELTLATEDGQVHRLGWSQVTWEAKDGSRFRYFMRELSDSEETSRRRGEARRDAEGAIKVVADLPEQSEFPMPKDVLFPIQHTEALIAAEAAGRGYMLAQLFDGSIGEQAMEVGAALGGGDTEWRVPGKPVPELDGQRSFPVGLAYFMSASPEGLPDTEQQLRLFANGVVGHLTFALGDINIQARLDEFRALKAEPC